MKWPSDYLGLFIILSDDKSTKQMLRIKSDDSKTSTERKFVETFVKEMSPYVGETDLPYAGGMTAKRWLGFLWFTHSGLSKSSTTRDCHAYHSSALGLATGSDVRTEMNYVPEKVSNLITSYFSAGSVMIDNDGAIECQITE